MKKDKKEILIFVILIAIFSATIAPKTFQNDTFFTIAIGETILEKGIDNREVLTWHNNLEFTNVRWLFNVIIAIIYRLFNFFGIYIFVIIMTVLIGITFFEILIKKKINTKLSFVMTILVMFLGQGILAARAQIVSIWLFLLEIYYIEKVLETNKKKDIAILLLIPILIANIHTSLFPMCFIFYLPYFTENILARILKNKDSSRIIIEKKKFIKTLLIIFIITLFLGLLTPLGTAPYTVMIEASKGISTDIIQELQPLICVDNTGFMLFIIIIFAIFAFSHTKIKVTDCFLLLGLSIMSLSTIRAIFYFLFIGGISIARIINQFLDDNNIYTYMFSNKQNNIIYVILSIFIVSISFSTLSDKMLNEYVDLEEYPVDACKYINNNLDVDNMRIYNGFNYGSYLEFQKIPSFMDSRSEIFCPEFNDTTILEDFSKLTKGIVHYSKIFDKYDITHALLYNSEITNIYIQYDENWECIYQDDIFALYEKK